jgi:hypothetical protein
MHQFLKFILFWNNNLHVSDSLFVHHLEFKTVCTATGILLYPAWFWWEHIADIAPGGTELELKLRRGAGQAAHARNNPHIRCTGVY